MKNKAITVICWIGILLAVAGTVVLACWKYFSGPDTQVDMAELEYADTLFDPSYVHTIDITVKEEDWNAMLAKAEEKQYLNCDVVIDGTKLQNVALRPKGMTSLSNVKKLGSERYSFKIDFDGFNAGLNYKGLDQLALNNIIQDNTYMKDYFSYRMMNEMGVAAPLCSYANITVNGKEFGLYLAVESIEESFAKRVYGTDYGKLYKPELAAADKEKGNWEVALRYKGDDWKQYPSIFDNAVFDTELADKNRLVESIRRLNAGENLEETVDVEEVLRYFAVHNFVVNFDSYTGILMHNYYLHENDGKLSMVAWDYNLAFGGGDMDLPISGTEEPVSEIDNSTKQVNYPIDTPVSMTTLEERPMLGKLLEREKYAAQYHAFLDEFLKNYMENGRFEQERQRVYHMILQYVHRDPTKFCTTEQFVHSADVFRDFCAMRTQSVRGQLNGEIPSTAERQEQNPSALVDASAINVTDMGSMMMEEEMSLGDGRAIDVNMIAALFGLDAQELEGKSRQEIVQTLIETMVNQGMMDRMGSDSSAMQNQIGQAILYGSVSLGVLAVGLVVVLLFRRRA